MKISTKFDFFQTVYLKGDPDQVPRVVTEIKLMPGCIVYQLTTVGYSEHYEQEISATKDQLKAVTT